MLRLIKEKLLKKIQTNLVYICGKIQLMINSISEVQLTCQIDYHFISLLRLWKISQSYIYNAILKYGHSNFSLNIIEYCSPEKCIERENLYLSSENHEYNILETAGSLLGYKHSDKTKQILSDAKKGEKNPMFGKKGENNPMYNKPRPEGAGSPSQVIEVTDIKNNQTTTYDSINKAARALNINHARIVMYFSRNQQKPYKGRYTFNKI